MVAASVPIEQLVGQHITFGYNEQTLLFDVSLRVQAGEMVALLGPNGSGKTTLLRLLSGVLRPRQGTILLEGRDLRSWGRRGIARRIAVVPQDLHTPFQFTVEHMVGMGRAPFQSSFLGAPSKEDDVMVAEAMEEAGVASLAGRVFNELSGGERQRVMIAMALAQQPAILLLDEPTSHLDIKYQIETLELVRHLNQRRATTVIAAIHDLNLAARYFPRLILFQRGIVADAGPAEVLDSALLKKVYGVDVQVGIMRGSVHLSILPPAENTRAEPHEVEQHPHIHVLAGGGSGEVLMRALADERYAFSAGALNIGDSDHTLALRLADDVITEQPYAPISPGALEHVRERFRHTGILILCPMPIGPGNVPLLREALAARRKGLTILLLDAPKGSVSVCLDGKKNSSEVVARDYTGGEGTQILTELVGAGAISFASVQEVLEWLRQHAPNNVVVRPPA
ncbi:ABC transporter ATP-binding protein [Ktedonospora formicarum]|uniref:Iron ABC transporter ATP-binding protein n=1 Tax=Ktedonospora formicarum TaxID=2778364 RepID=A0A8J3I7X3_9CHLR|nr:ABC transporter ATP-binding protein [Ktedonospora formicarum]GHO50271.1 iron ABC transporter ATP-binding protein [Ktedonospora formicarum]